MPLLSRFSFGSICGDAPTLGELAEDELLDVRGNTHAPTVSAKGGRCSTRRIGRATLWRMTSSAHPSCRRPAARRAAAGPGRGGVLDHAGRRRPRARDRRAPGPPRAQPRRALRPAAAARARAELIADARRRAPARAPAADRRCPGEQPTVRTAEVDEATRLPVGAHRPRPRDRAGLDRRPQVGRPAPARRRPGAGRVRAAAPARPRRHACSRPRARTSSRCSAAPWSRRRSTAACCRESPARA